MTNFWDFAKPPTPPKPLTFDDKFNQYFDYLSVDQGSDEARWTMPSLTKATMHIGQVFDQILCYTIDPLSFETLVWILRDDLNKDPEIHDYHRGFDESNLWFEVLLEDEEITDLRLKKETSQHDCPNQ